MQNCGSCRTGKASVSNPTHGEGVNPGMMRLHQIQNKSDKSRLADRGSLERLVQTETEKARSGWSPYLSQGQEERAGW